jgi:hypothetical protein
VRWLPNPEPVIRPIKSTNRAVQKMVVLQGEWLGVGPVCLPYLRFVIAPPPRKGGPVGLEGGEGGGGEGGGQRGDVAAVGGLPAVQPVVAGHGGHVVGQARLGQAGQRREQRTHSAPRGEPARQAASHAGGQAGPANRGSVHTMHPSGKAPSNTGCTDTSRATAGGQNCLG